MQVELWREDRAPIWFLNSLLDVIGSSRFSTDSRSELRYLPLGVTTETVAFESAKNTVPTTYLGLGRLATRGGQSGYRLGNGLMAAWG